MIKKILVIAGLASLPLIVGIATAEPRDVKFDRCLAGCIESRPGQADWCVAECTRLYDLN